MTVILTILKIIGIVLMVILALILLLLLLLLFAPFRYRADVDAHSGQVKAGVRVSWVIRLLYVAFDFDGTKETDKTALEAYLCGIPLLKLMKKMKEKKAAKGAEKAAAPKKKKKKKKKKSKEEPPFYSGVKKRPTVTPASEGKTYVKKVEVVPRKEPGKLERIVSGITAFFGKIKKFFTKLGDITETIGEWIDYLESDAFASAFSTVMKRLKKILKHPMPRKIEGTLEFGMEDPSVTGMILAAAAAMYPKLPPRLALQPDFEGKKLEADVRISGHITIGYLLWQALLVILNKNVRGFLKRLKNKDAKPAEPKDKKDAGKKTSGESAAKAA